MREGRLLKVSLFFFAAISVMVLCWPVRFADAFFLDLWLSFLWAIGIALASPLDGWKGSGMTFLFALLPVAASIIYYDVSFSSDESFLVAGVIPWSDAYMHFRQASQMAVEGVTHTGMNGRFLYPAYFSSLLTITGLNVLWAHALVEICFAGALTITLRRVASLFGMPGAMIMALVCWLFFRARCSGLVMTENLGILCGLLSLTLFLISIQRKNIALLLFGIFMLSLGLCARPGALFVLPFMVLFAGYMVLNDWQLTFNKPHASIWKSVVIMFLALSIIVAAFGSNTLLEKTVYQGKKVITNGNFPFTLYGMLIGGKWSDAASRFHWNSQLAMQESLSLVKEKPQLLVMGAARAYREAVGRRILFMFHHESRPATILLLLALLGLVAVWKQETLQPYALWVTFMAAGILLSIPFAPPWDADERPFAATVPFQALLASIGFFVLVRWLIFKITQKNIQEEILKNFSALPVVIFSVVIFLLSVPLPILHGIGIAHHEGFQDQRTIKLRAGSVVTLTPKNSIELHRRLAPFLMHNPDQRFLFDLITNHSSLAINWGNKNCDRCIILPDASKMVNMNGWTVDQRLLPEHH